MMIDAGTLPAFLHGFGGFCDSLLQSISVEYLPTGKRRLLLELRARDWAETQSDRWQDVRIVLEDVGDYRFGDEERKSMSVLSNGIHLVRIDARWCLELGYSEAPPRTLEEARQSSAFAIAQRAEYTITPIPEP